MVHVKNYETTVSKFVKVMQRTL